MIFGLADVTGRLWASPKEELQGPNGQERRRRPTEKSHSKQPAEMTMIPMESICSRRTTTKGVQGDPIAVGGEEQGDDQDNCDLCRAVLKVGEHGNVEPHHQP